VLGIVDREEQRSLARDRGREFGQAGGEQARAAAEDGRVERGA
jgi:hypothetical protein